MSKKNDGGPAFPRVGEGFNNPYYSTPGMSLRDWFAGQALIALMSSNEYGHLTSDRFPEFAFEVADAMIAARNKETTDTPKGATADGFGLHKYHWMMQETTDE